MEAKAGKETGPGHNQAILAAGARYSLRRRTWSIWRFGSGEMTVRPLKSTRLPDRLPRNRPCLPFRRCTKPREGRPVVWNCDGSPGRSLLISMAHWTCMATTGSSDSRTTVNQRRPNDKD